MATFRDKKQAVCGIFSTFLQYKSTAKQHHYWCKIIVYVGSSQKSKRWHSHLHNTCTLFKLKCNLLTGKLPDIRALFIIIWPSMKDFYFSAVHSLNLKLNSSQAECCFCKGKSFSVVRAMTSSTESLYPPATDSNFLVLFWMPGVVVRLDIKFLQTSDVISANQAKSPFILLNNKILHKQHVDNIRPSWRIFGLFRTRHASHKIASLESSVNMLSWFYQIQSSLTCSTIWERGTTKYCREKYGIFHSFSLLYTLSDFIPHARIITAIFVSVFSALIRQW